MDSEPAGPNSQSSSERHEPTLAEVQAILGTNNGKRPVLLYIPGRQKRPQFEQWQKVTYIQTQDEGYQSSLKAHPNTGVLLGGSENLCTIDCDTDAFLKAFTALNPWAAETLLSRGESGGQLWFYCKGIRPHRVERLRAKADSPLAVGAKKVDEDGYSGIGEFRAEGGQSVIRGIHPCGCKYCWLHNKSPVIIEFGEIRWPYDIVIPWGRNKRAKQKGKVAAGDLTLLNRAIERVSVDQLWEEFGYEPRQGKNPVPSPFRDDRHPSFSVYDEGRRWKDHGTGEHGDSYDFYQQATKRDAGAAFVPFVELAALGHELKQKNAPGPQEREGDSETKEKTTRPLSGRSVAFYARREIDQSKNLLGNRWLCRTGGALVIAPSGMGKSSWSLQATILWSCGRIAFALKTNKIPLRILITQAEDDDDDLTEMTRMMQQSLGLTEAQKTLVDQYTSIERVNDVTDSDFIDVLAGFLEQARAAGKPFDLVIINPLNAYTDPTDPKALKAFLRGGLNRLMTQYDTASLLVCHTAKTNFQQTDDFNWHDWQYVGKGSSELADWARAILVLWPLEPGIFQLRAAKRAKRTGWADTEQFIKWADGDEILWTPLEADEGKELKARTAEKHTSGRTAVKVPSMLLPFLSLIEWRNVDTVTELVNAPGVKPGLSERKVPQFLEKLVRAGEAEVREISRSGTRPFKEYRRLPKSDGKKEAANDH